MTIPDSIKYAVIGFNDAATAQHGKILSKHTSPAACIAAQKRKVNQQARSGSVTWENIEPIRVLWTDGINASGDMITAADIPAKEQA